MYHHGKSILYNVAWTLRKNFLYKTFCKKNVPLVRQMAASSHLNVFLAYIFPHERKKKKFFNFKNLGDGLGRWPRLQIKHFCIIRELRPVFQIQPFFLICNWLYAFPKSDLPYVSLIFTYYVHLVIAKTPNSISVRRFIESLRNIWNVRPSREWRRWTISMLVYGSCSNLPCYLLLRRSSISYWNDFKVTETFYKNKTWKINGSDYKCTLFQNTSCHLEALKLLIIERLGFFGHLDIALF